MSFDQDRNCLQQPSTSTSTKMEANTNSSETSDKSMSNDANVERPFALLLKGKKSSLQQPTTTEKTGNGKCRVNGGIQSSPLATTPISNRSTELTNSVITCGGGARSKSSSRSGSSRSALRIFKNGSRSSQCSTSKAQIVSPAPSSLATSLSHWQNQQHQKDCVSFPAKIQKANSSSFKLVQVHTLSKENIVVAVERKCQVWDIFHCCCVHLGIDDDRLFGLAIRRPSDGLGGAEDRPRHEYFFLDPDQKISKYVPKQAKQSLNSGSVSSPVLQLKNRIGSGSINSIALSKPVIVVYMRVRVYVRRIDMISCDLALRHYYLQLRENLIDQWSAGPNSGASEEACWELAALAILTDKGREWRSINDSNSNAHTSFSFRAEQYFPLWVINSRGLDYIHENMPKVLRGYGNANGSSANAAVGSTSLSSTAPSSSSASSPLTAVSSALTAALNESEAMFQFCQEASRGPFALNCHLYGLRRHKTDILNNALIGITDRGIDMWDVGEQGERILLSSLAWSKMARLSFDNKRITIAGVDGSKLALFSETEYKARYLLMFCREVHQQLIQINTNFVLNRPPTSPLLPPGWGLERLIDSSPISTSFMRHFNNAEYGAAVGVDRSHNQPAYHLKSETILPEKPTPAPAPALAPLTKIVAPSSQLNDSVVSPSQPKFETKKMSKERKRRSHIARISTPPPIVRRTLKPNAVEMSMDQVGESKSKLDIIPNQESNVYFMEPDALAASEIVFAMNGAPSPPKFVGPQEAPISTINVKEKRALPPSCLKQSKMTGQSNPAGVQLHSNPIKNSQNTIPTKSIYSDVVLQQQSYLPPSVLGGNVTVSPQKVCLARIRPPPQYSEAIEQLKRRTNSNGTPASGDSTMDVNPVENLSKQQQLFHTSVLPITAQQEHNNKMNESTPQLQRKQGVQINVQQQLSLPSSCPSKIGGQLSFLQSQPTVQQPQQCVFVAEYGAHDNVSKRPLSFQPQGKVQLRQNNFSEMYGSDIISQLNVKQPVAEQQKQWHDLSNQQEFLQPFQQQKNYMLKYGSVVEGSSSSQNSFVPFLQAKSEPKLNFEDYDLDNKTETIQQDRNVLLNVSVDVDEQCEKLLKQTRYVCRSPTSNQENNRVKSLSSASNFTQNCITPVNDVSACKIFANNAQQKIDENQQEKVQSLQLPLPDRAKVTDIQDRLSSLSLLHKTVGKNNLDTTDLAASTINYAIEKDLTNSDNINLEVFSKAKQNGSAPCHFVDSSVSNTEKFKNYPMMKALWEARHDLTTALANSNFNDNALHNLLRTEVKVLSTSDVTFDESQYGEYPFEENFQQADGAKKNLFTSSLATSVTKSPPSYNQFQQQQEMQRQQKLYSIEQTIPPSTTSKNVSSSKSGFKVLDLPPPPPYPQNLLSSSSISVVQQSSAPNSSTCKTAPLVM